MKAPLYFYLVIFFLYSCRSSSRVKIPEDDSLQFYPPTPAQMDRDRFRYYYRKLGELTDTGLLKRGFNGGLLFAKNGAILYEQYIGRSDMRKKDSISPATSFHIASTSKPFTALALLQLVQEKKINLSDSLEQFFPAFPYKGITIQMLLNHRSGLPNYLYFMSNNKWGILPNGKWNRRYATNYDVVKMLYEKIPDPTSPPGASFHYSNTNYVLLALVIEKISGKTFPSYMKDRIFQPLGMEHTYVFTLADTLTATPTFTNSNTYWSFDFLDATYGDKNMYSTPRDLLKWDQALYSEQLISKSLLDSAFSPNSPEKQSIHNYGLGWRMFQFPGNKKIVYHFGRWHGSNSAFARLLEDTAVIIILGNKFNRAIYETAIDAFPVFGEYTFPSRQEAGNSDSTEKQTVQETKRKRDSH